MSEKLFQIRANFLVQLIENEFKLESVLRKNNISKDSKSKAVETKISQVIQLYIPNDDFKKYKDTIIPSNFFDDLDSSLINQSINGTEDYDLYNELLKEEYKRSCPEDSVEDKDYEEALHEIFVDIHVSNVIKCLILIV